MPSYGELEQEDAWIDEYEPQALRDLASSIEGFLPGSQVWISGDNSHLRGYHRSRRWIKESIYCTNHSYSVTRTAGDVPTIVVIQALFEAADVSSPPPALARTW